MDRPSIFLICGLMGESADADITNLLLRVMDDTRARSRRRSSSVPVRSARAAEESADVGGELGVVLEQESVCRVGVDLQLSPRDQAGQQVGVVRQDHRVA